jgi:hypothetical protein
MLRRRTVIATAAAAFAAPAIVPRRSLGQTCAR